LRTLVVSKPVSVRAGGAGWHLIGVDVDRADRGLEVVTAG
jgi:hypothetical protein